MSIELHPVGGIGEIARGTDLGAVIAAACEASAAGLRDGDVLVVTQKIVSKAEGAVVAIDATLDRLVALFSAENNNPGS